jgi:hypothetical protein
MDHNWVTAISTAISAGATIALVFAAIVQLDGLKQQIKQASDQDRRRNTLEACQRFEKDPLVKLAMKNLWEATEFGTDYRKLTAENLFDALTLLNYLLGIAVGVEQKVYLEQMTKDFLEPVVYKAVKALIKGEDGTGWKVTKSFVPAADFVSLCKLYDQWFPQKGPEYRAEP